MHKTIRDKLTDAFAPLHLEVTNESHMHDVPPGSESHFKIVLVSDHFEGKSLIKRHRLVNALLADELAGELHAVALHTMTPTEWFDRGGESPDSPECRGGGKA